MKIEFDTSNDAFQECGTYEIKRILNEIGKQLDNGITEGVIMDINGNKIGNWKI